MTRRWFFLAGLFVLCGLPCEAMLSSKSMPNEVRFGGQFFWRNLSNASASKEASWWSLKKLIVSLLVVAVVVFTLRWIFVRKSQMHQRTGFNLLGSDSPPLVAI